MNMPEKVEFLPLHAINEFMRDDYRLTVLNEVFVGLDQIPAEKKAAIGKLVAHYVTVQGFRNGNLAPAGRKAKGSATLFERSAEFVGLVVESWRSLHSELASTMFAVLIEHEWGDLLPLEADRSQLPGFGIHWPKKDTFDVLIKAVQIKEPQLQESDDNISLMAVWLGNRLPYDLFAEESEEESAEKE
jgi:hypothetical protein